MFLQIDKDKKTYLACEQWWVFLTIIFVAGFYGAFTFLLRGGVFCNAQTVNLMMVAINIAKTDFSKALYYCIPIIAFFVGILLSEIVPSPFKRLRIIRWDTLLILIEIVTVLIIGFLPANTPFRVSHILINLITAMQYNTFRQVCGVPMTTTFCTNELRQMSVALIRALKHRDKSFGAQFVGHLGMVLSFALGAGLGAFLCNVLGDKAIFAVLLPLSVVFIYLLYADLVPERDRLLATPHGH